MLSEKTETARGAWFRRERDGCSHCPRSREKPSACRAGFTSGHGPRELFLHRLYRELPGTGKTDASTLATADPRIAVAREIKKKVAV